MSGTDFVAEATAELYSLDPEGFTERRAALASQARAAGDRAAAKEIAGLRKPTRPAWMINHLVRSDPGVADRLAGLGDELRAAEAALDGAKIRELSRERRKLVDSLVRRTLQQAGERSPSAALREDLTATFGAALADPQVARDLTAGTLLRAARHADFGAGAPVLTLVPPPAEDTAATPPPGREAETSGAKASGAKASASGAAAGDRRPGRAARPCGPGEKTKAADETRAAARAEEARAAQRAEEAGAARAAQRAEEAEEARAARAARDAQERQQAITEAQQALEEASREAEQAAQEEQDARDNVQALEAQLDEAHRRVTGARRRARTAHSALQKARHAVERLTPARADRGRHETP